MVGEGALMMIRSAHLPLRNFITILRGNRIRFSGIFRSLATILHEALAHLRVLKSESLSLINGPMYRPLR